jgi:hypothetical protein
MIITRWYKEARKYTTQSQRELDPADTFF